MDQFSDLCRDYKLTDDEKIKRLPRYCDMRIEQTIETMKEWRKRDWTKFRHSLREEYESADQAQTYHSRDFLETFKDRQRTDDEDPQRYCRQFARISDELTKKNRLDNYTRVLWFVQGLPKHIKKRLCSSHDGLNTDEYEKIDFDTILEKTLEIAKGNRRLYRITNQPVKRGRLSHLADLCDSKPKWNSRSSDEDFFVPPIVPAVPALIALGTPEAVQKQTQKIQDDSMAFLTKTFEAMALSLQTQFAAAFRTAHVSPAFTQPQQPNSFSAAITPFSRLQYAPQPAVWFLRIQVWLSEC